MRNLQPTSATSPVLGCLTTLGMLVVGTILIGTLSVRLIQVNVDNGFNILFFRFFSLTVGLLISFIFAAVIVRVFLMHTIPEGSVAIITELGGKKIVKDTEATIIIPLVEKIERHSIGQKTLSFAQNEFTRDFVQVKFNVTVEWFENVQHLEKVLNSAEIDAESTLKRYIATDIHRTANRYPLNVLLHSSHTFQGDILRFAQKRYQLHARAHDVETQRKVKQAEFEIEQAQNFVEQAQRNVKQAHLNADFAQLRAQRLMNIAANTQDQASHDQAQAALKQARQAIRRVEEAQKHADLMNTQAKDLFERLYGQEDLKEIWNIKSIDLSLALINVRNILIEIDIPDEVAQLQSTYHQRHLQEAVAKSMGMQEAQKLQEFDRIAKEAHPQTLEHLQKMEAAKSGMLHADVNIQHDQAHHFLPPTGQP